MFRTGFLITILTLCSSTTFASDGKYVLNFDLNTKVPDGTVAYTIQLQGISILPNVPFHGDDLGKYDYFLTVSNVKDGIGKLTIEFYEYETRKKVSDVVSEIVTDVDFSISSPTVYEAMSDTFGIDLAFSIAED